MDRKDARGRQKGVQITEKVYQKTQLGTKRHGLNNSDTYLLSVDVPIGADTPFARAKKQQNGWKKQTSPSNVTT